MIRANGRVARSVSVAAVVAATASFSGPPVEQIVINENRVPAGTLAAGLLTIHLDAREGEWHGGDVALGFDRGGPGLFFVVVPILLLLVACGTLR